jgi:hypothetical protein
LPLRNYFSARAKQFGSITVVSLAQGSALHNCAKLAAPIFTEPEQTGG